MHNSTGGFLVSVSIALIHMDIVLDVVPSKADYATIVLAYAFHLPIQILNQQ